MYRLPKTQDLSFLIGVELEQVCVGRHAVILNFDRSVQISMLTSFAIASRRGELPVTHDDSVAGGSAMLACLGESVARAEATDDGGLLLEFVSGTTLTIIDDSEQYESFWIGYGDELIVA